MALGSDVRFSLRMLAANRGFAAAAVACLALGVGATTAIFSVVHAVLLRPLPYAESARLVRVFTEFPKFPNGGLRHFWVSPPEYFDLQRDLRSFEMLEGWANQGVNLASPSEPVRANASYVTGGMLELLGVAPRAGRLLSTGDDRPGVPAVAVLSWGLWQRSYGGDPAVLGRDIRLNGRPCTVVGVMPPSFAFPPGEIDAPELWVPLQLDPAKPGGRGSHFLSLLGRLRPGVGIAGARDEMLRYARHSSETTARSKHPFDPALHPLVAAGFQEEVVRGVRPAMLVLLGAVAFVLLIACVNVASLLLARAEARRREIAVRAAMGAGTGRLLAQFVTEGLLLSVVGAGAGVLLAAGGLRLLAATGAGSIPRAAEIGIDWTVMAFALAISIATGVVFGLAPLLHIRPGGLHEILKSSSGRSTGALAAARFRRALVGAELALALVLLIGAGLMTKAFWRLQHVEPGFNAAHLLTMRLSLPETSYTAARASNFWPALLDAVNGLPGVVSASLASGLQPARPLNANDTAIEGFVPVPGGPIENIDYWNFVGPGYFETMGARLLEGRYLNSGDGNGAPLVVVVNRTLARAYWPRESALGHRVKADYGPTAQWRTIVGVVADMKNAGLDRPAGAELFIPFLQRGANSGASGTLLVRTAGEPAALAGAVRRRIRALDAGLPVSNVRPMEEVVAATQSRPRFLTLLLALFSTLSLTLAALGVYGVISYSVAQRTGEIGIRMALGARPGDVLRLIGAGGLRLALAGTAAGAVGAFALTRFLSGLLFGVSAVDAATFGGMAALLIGVTLVACFVPARRASRVDPVQSLHYE